MFWRSGAERSEGARKYTAPVAIPLFYGTPAPAPSAFLFVVVVVVVVFPFLIVVVVFLCVLTRI